MFDAQTMQMTFWDRSELVIQHRRQRVSVMNYKVLRNQNTTSGVLINFLIPEYPVSA
jgi:hypothetical protein